MKLIAIKVNDYGGAPMATHNYPCPVFRDEHAVLLLNTGVFYPSRKAGALGWRLVRAESWFQRLLIQWFFKEGMV